MTPDGQLMTSAERGELIVVQILLFSPISCSLVTHRKFKTLENYKFYLAFENLGVADYVSEKVSGLFVALPVSHDPLPS